jgi:signal transduction histidine kinase
MDTPAPVNDVVVLFLAGTAAFFLLAGGVVAFALLAQRRLLRQRLQLTELEARHRERLLYENLEAVEAERKRMAKDLHDELGGMLSILSLKVGQFDQPALVRESQTLIDSSLGSMRRIAHDLLPPGIEMFGLADALEGLCARLASHGAIGMEFTAPEPTPRFDPRAELCVYRIVQELINNSLRHGEASRIELELSAPAGGALTLRYADNGRGFDPAALPRGRGLGLQNIALRLKLLRGTGAWRRAEAGGGMEFRFTFPTDVAYGAEPH